jgi:hypothetical protein
MGSGLGVAQARDPKLVAVGCFLKLRVYAGQYIRVLNSGEVRSVRSGGRGKPNDRMTAAVGPFCRGSGFAGRTRGFVRVDQIGTAVAKGKIAGFVFGMTTDRKLAGDDGLGGTGRVTVFFRHENCLGRSEDLGEFGLRCAGGDSAIIHAQPAILGIHEIGVRQFWNAAGKKCWIRLRSRRAGKETTAFWQRRFVVNVLRD